MAIAKTQGKPPVDPLDALAATPVDPTILASLKAAGVSMADPNQQGHGVPQQADAAARVQVR